MNIYFQRACKPVNLGRKCLSLVNRMAYEMLMLSNKSVAYLPAALSV
jgi:hypothetical protein